MSEMKERMARAIEGAMFAPHELPLSDDLHRKYLEVAHAAIASMRMPTLDVLTAAYNAEPIPSMRAEMPHYFRAWRAGVDEAMK